MSAHSELRRLVVGCTDLLEAEGTPASQGWADALAAASAIAADDLSEAATRVLALARRTPPITAAEFSTHAQSEQFQERCDHMLALARVLVGEPPEKDER